MPEAALNGVLMAVIGFLGTLAGYAFSFLRDRDKLRYDAALVALKRQHKDCERRHSALQRRVTNVEKTVKRGKQVSRPASKPPQPQPRTRKRKVKT